MYHDDDALGGFLGLLMIGGAFFFGNKMGQKKAYREISDQQRDNEIADLKRQIQDMRHRNEIS